MITKLKFGNLIFFIYFTHKVKKNPAFIIESISKSANTDSLLVLTFTFCGTKSYQSP